MGFTGVEPVLRRCSGRPQINVGTVYDYLDSDKSTYLKRVFNSGDGTAFVKVNILEIIYDADGSHREVPVRQQADGSSRDGLMASPARLIVPANGMQATRLVLMGKRDTERYFRVRFVPVVRKRKTSSPFPAKSARLTRKTFGRRQCHDRVWHGVLCPAERRRFDTVIDDRAGVYRLRNNGNTVVVIDEFRNCSQKNETDCEPTTKHHLLAGKSFEFEKKPGREYRFNLVEGAARKRCVSPASNPRRQRGIRPAAFFDATGSRHDQAIDHCFVQRDGAGKCASVRGQEARTFEVSVDIPTLDFYVLPAEANWIHLQQTLPWNIHTSTLQGCARISMSNTAPARSKRGWMPSLICSTGGTLSFCRSVSMGKLLSMTPPGSGFGGSGQ
jgi:hypothetical protein